MKTILYANISQTIREIGMGNGEAKVSGDTGMSKLSEIEERALRDVLANSAVKGEVSEDVIMHKLDFPAGGDVWLTSIWGLIASRRKHPSYDDLKAVYETVVYGNLEDQVRFIAFLLENTKLSKEQFALWLVQGAEATSESWKNWEEIGVPISAESQNSLVQYLGSDHDGNIFNNLEVWLMRRPLILDLLKAIFRHGFRCSEGHENNLFPVLVDVDPTGPKPSVLASTEVLFLNSLLPHDLSCEWRLVFSTKRHGQSFSTLLAKITNQGPTLIVVRDTDGHIFGGFASVAWSIGPNFIGDSRCFLFTVCPKMAMYVTTGYNDHYMYLNQQQQTLPNGLGMGGQHEYFGLWLDAEFGKGHSSKSCTTYGDYNQLSKNPVFNVDNIEVWSVGKPRRPDTDSDEPNQRSILDRDPTAKALLELIDRGQHSEGLREPDPV